MSWTGVPARYLGFIARSLLISWDIRRTGPRFLEQAYIQGVSALPIVLLAGVFVGLTTAVQTTYQLMGVVPKYFVGMGVGRLVLIELAPVFTAFVVAGRSASATAAELGAMRVSEQIDALTVMGINPYRFLCLPRIAALLMVLPVLVVAMEAVAILVALVISSLALDVSTYAFMYGVTHFFMARDFIGGLVKAAIFGLLIGVNGCFAGFSVAGGSEQVGRAATRAVVGSAAMVLAVDFLVALVFFRI
jgi:phospholipid/cholesterol/gamma-HCH transport system permease protein